MFKVIALAVSALAVGIAAWPAEAAPNDFLFESRRRFQGGFRGASTARCRQVGHPNADRRLSASAGASALAYIHG